MTDITVKEFNFSEVQSSKDICDARTISCRLHILNYVNEAHDAADVFQMKNALESQGGVFNTCINHRCVHGKAAEAIRPVEGMLHHAIQHLIFEEDILRMIKAY